MSVKQIILDKPETDKDRTIIATDRGWEEKSYDLDFNELLVEYDQNGGFLTYLHENQITGPGIPDMKQIGYIPPGEITAGSTGNYDSADIYILLVPATNNAATNGIFFTATTDDQTVEVGIGMAADAKANIGVYEYDGTKPTLLVGQAMVHNTQTTTNWGKATLQLKLTAGKQYCIGVNSISGQIIEEGISGGSKRYPLVDGKLPIDVTNVASPTTSNWNVAAYALFADYTHA